MKKTLCAVLSLLFVAFCVTCSWADYYNEGHSGNSRNDAYVIDSIEDWQLLSTRVNNLAEPSGKYYRLEADLRIDGTDSLVGSNSTHPFRGHFDGNGKTITIVATGYGVAPFRCISADSSEAPAVENLNVWGNLEGVQGDGSAGVAYYLINGSIRNCTFRGKVAGGYNYAPVAGIVAQMYGGEVDGCRVNQALVNSREFIWSTQSGEYAGGIVGQLYAGTVKNCEAYARVANASYSGAVIGTISGTREVCTITNNTFALTEHGIGYGFDGSPSDEGCTAAWNVYTMEGNDGASPETAYVIDSLEDFVLMRDRVNDGTEPAKKFYRLSADLSITNANGGFEDDYFIPVGAFNNHTFKGYFDGNNKTITLNIQTDNSAGYSQFMAGDWTESLFGFVEQEDSGEDTCAIKNLNVVGQVSTKKGGAAGIVYGLFGRIKNCTFSGNISGYGNGGAGGIAAVVAGSVEDCSVLAGSSVTLSGIVVPDTSFAGGIAGGLAAGSITDCTSLAEVSGANFVGGIVGRISTADNFTMSGNRYSGADYGIGTIGEDNDNAYPSDEGCTKIEAAPAPEDPAPDSTPEPDSTQPQQSDNTPPQPQQDNDNTSTGTGGTNTGTEDNNTITNPDDSTNANDGVSGGGGGGCSTLPGLLGLAALLMFRRSR